MTYPWIQFFLLCLFWALHAYIIHPYMVMRLYGKKSQDLEWVKMLLRLPHSLLMEHINSSYRVLYGDIDGLIKGSQANLDELIKGNQPDIEGYLERFAQELGGLVSESMQEHMEGVKGAVIGPLSKQAKQIEGQIQEQVDQATEQYVAPGVSLPGMEKSLDRLYKRYPLFHDVMAAKQLSEQLLPQLQGQKGGGKGARGPFRSPEDGGGHDF